MTHRPSRPARSPAGPVPSGPPAPGGAYRRSSRASAQSNLYLALLKLAAQMERQIVELLKTADLTVSQYNVLRILRGGGEEGLSCGEIGGRLIRHDPDVTRLVDRLEARGLIARQRQARDRRVVLTRITRKGLDVLAALDGPLDALHDRQLGHFDDERLATLAGWLEEARRAGT
jgi:DNA-binding MarR family transcriptional regulator